MKPGGASHPRPLTRGVPATCLALGIALATLVAAAGTGVAAPLAPTALLAAGAAQPIGGLELPENTFPTLTQGLFKDITLTNYKVLGTAPSSPDFEAMAAAHPNLIVGVLGKDTPNLHQLEAIAPVADISLTMSGAGQTGIAAQPWYAEVELLAQILNRQAQANAFVASYEAAAATVRPELTGKSASYVSYPGAQDLSVEGPEFYIGPVLTYLGLTVPPVPSGGSLLSGTNPDNEDVRLSLERASSLDVQYLLVFTETPQLFQSFVSNPVVALAPAIQAGRVLNPGPGSPYFGFPIEGCVALLDDIPLIAHAFETTGEPTYHALGQVGPGGSLSSVDYGGYRGPLYTASGETYTRITSPGVQLAPGTTVYGI